MPACRKFFRAPLCRALPIALTVLAACERGSAAPPTDPGTSNAPPIVLTSASNSVFMPRGWNALVSLLVGRRSDFTNPVALTIDGLPRGMTAVFATPTVPANVSSTQLSLEADSSVAFGTFPLTVRATSGNVTTSTTLSVSVPRPSFQLTATSAITATIGAFAPASAGLVVQRDYFYRGRLTFSVTDVPAGVTAGSTFVIPSESSTGSVLFVPNESATPGTYRVTVHMIGPDVDERTASVQLTIAR